MDFNLIHNFDLTKETALSIQNELKSQISIKPLKRKINKIAGVDVSYKGKTGLAAICVFNYTTHELIETQKFKGITNFDYEPGFLAFRELPLIIEAWKLIETRPDVVVFDGHGQIHPRRMGLATHASFFLKLPTIGLAKKHYIGKFKEPSHVQGNYTYIEEEEDVIGVCYRSKPKSKPIFVSVGNFITLEESVKIITASLDVKTSNRLPYVTFIPDQITKQEIKSF